MFPIRSVGRGFVSFQLVFVSVWLSRCSMFPHWKSVSRVRMIDFTDECCCVVLLVGARMSISKCRSNHQKAAELFELCEWRIQWIMVAIVL